MAYTIAENEAKMTVYYSKSTGALKGVYSGIQDMSVFGADAEDYTTIWKFEVIDIDEYVLQNPDKFIMNVSTDIPILSLKEASIITYPVI